MTIGCLFRDKPTSAVVTVSPDAPVSDAVRLLHDHRIGAVLAVGPDGVAGVVSERDVVRGLHKHGSAICDMPVHKVMSSPVVTVERSHTISDALALMTERRFRHLPVVEGGVLIGIVSIGDLVKRKIDDAVREAEELRGYIHA
ncbi:MAG: CBS domain-containing protein [Sphingomonadaceae bacterium]|nr:CBS domain-containing protein [Sphingomonadaceae bacterium]